ncbi:trypsin-like serine protease [Leptothermofonsia sichuanensis E412]|uniref:trypsin-like serine protease n=1 Tax=Leptothermofonsia sichuanensis TaxID=2917832 RepID=UPI001CA6BDC2|nr:trypsin-like serine protease [Leptothermofonsia sichuanensis]QZZ20386.1 trypsin-like serine protease [Leptothermofonsia sichuanensis E412]
MNMHRWLGILAGTAVITSGSRQAEAIVVVDDASLFRQQALPGQFSGVVSLEGDVFSDGTSIPFCTGSLLKGGLHILTAAHCLTEDTNQISPGLINQPFFATFNLASGVTQVPILDLFIFQGWDGTLTNGNDIAILSLLEPAPSEAEQYDIYRETNELGQIFTKVGYGRTGNGIDGETTTNGLVAYFGQNQFEGTEADLVNLLISPPTNPAPFSQLLFDFDSGFRSNNLLGSLGLGINEVNTASGDSGGPAFIDNRIAGITSYGVGGFGLLLATDIDELTNSTFGELSGETRVSTYASFVDGVLLGNIAASAQNTAAIPEPSTILGMAIFGGWMLRRRKVQKRDR